MTRLGSVAAWGLAATAFLVVPLAALAPKGLTPLGVGAGLFAAAALRARAQPLPPAFLWLTAAIAALLAWCWLSALWALDPGLAVRRAEVLTLIAVVGPMILAGTLALPADRQSWLGAGLCAGLGVGVAFMAVDAMLDGALRHAIRDDPGYYSMSSLNRGATVAVLVVWPAALWLWRRGVRADRRWMRAAAPALALSCVGLLALLESESSMAALAVGAATFAVVALARGIGTRLLAAALALGTMAAPALSLTILSPDRVLAWTDRLGSTAVHRLFIWHFTAERILERPWLGWGLDAARAMPGRDTHIVTLRPDLPYDVYKDMQVLPLHPHNAPLQVWLELGLPGAILFAALSAGLLLWLARRVPGRMQAAAAASVLSVALAMSSFSYGIWQTWWLAALWLAAVATAAVLRMPARPRG